MAIGNVSHNVVSVEDIKLFYREAGSPQNPAILLLHGFPSSSHTFRQVMRPLAEDAYVIAPDLPGFGFSDSPLPCDYSYTFENIAKAVQQLLHHLRVERFYVFLHDFGCPVGYFLALWEPERILGLIVQNGNAHLDGLGETWKTTFEYWANPTWENKRKIPSWLHFEGTKAQYLGSLPERLHHLISPECWHLDWERMTREGNIEAQWQLYEDYKHHVERFPLIHEYHLKYQPPCIVLWGRHDPFFSVNEVLCYNEELERCEIHVLDGGHFLLETHDLECIRLIRSFIS